MVGSALRGYEEAHPDEEVIIPGDDDGIEYHYVKPANVTGADSSTASVTEVSTSMCDGTSIAQSEPVVGVNWTVPSGDGGFPGKHISKIEYLKLISMLSQYQQHQKMNEALIEENTKLIAQVQRLWDANAKLTELLWTTHQMSYEPIPHQRPNLSTLNAYNCYSSSVHSTVSR